MKNKARGNHMYCEAYVFRYDICIGKSYSLNRTRLSSHRLDSKQTHTNAHCSGEAYSRYDGSNGGE